MHKPRTNRELTQHSDNTSRSVGLQGSKPRTGPGSRKGRTAQLSTTREVGAKEGEPGSLPELLKIGHRAARVSEMSTDDLLNLGEPKPPSKTTRSGQTLVSSSASRDKSAENGRLTRSNSIQSDKDFKAETRRPRKASTTERNDSKVTSRHANISPLACLPPRGGKREHYPLVPDRSRDEPGKPGAGDGTRRHRDVASSAESSTSSLHRVDSAAAAAKPGQHTGRKHPSSIASNGCDDLSRITSFSSTSAPWDGNTTDTTLHHVPSPHELEFALNKQSKEMGGSNDSKLAIKRRKKAHDAQCSSESPRVTEKTPQPQKLSRWTGFGPFGEKELPPVDIDKSKVYTPSSFDAWSNSTFGELRAREGGRNR